MQTLEDVAASVAANLRACRLKRGLTQQQLAEDAEMGLQTYRDIEQMRTIPGLAVLTKLANTMEIEIAKLFVPAEPEEPTMGRPRKS